MKVIALLSFLIGPAVLLAQRGPGMNPNRNVMAPPNGYQYGNILFPGGIPAQNTHAGRLGATIAGGSYTGVAPGTSPGAYGRGRTVIVPYAYPVYMGGGYYGGGYDQAPPTNVTVVVPQQPNPAPQVIINNNYIPERANPSLKEYAPGELPETDVRVYEGPAKPRAESSVRPSGRSIADEKPNVYLIALKDGTIRQAIGYWLKDGTLHYVTPDSSMNHVSADQVDRHRTVELNAERKLDFELRD